MDAKLPPPERICFGSLYRRRVWSVLLCSGVAGCAATAALAQRVGRAAAAGAASAVTLLLVCIQMGPRRQLRNIPGPTPDLLGGNLRETYESPNGVVDCSIRWHRKHGPLVRVQLGPTVQVMCNDPEEIERQFRGTEPFLNRPKPPLKVPYPHLLFARGAEWQRMRRTIAPIFSDKQLSVFSKPMEDAVSVLLDILWEVPAGRPVDIWKNLGSMTMDVIGSSAFGVQLDCQKTNSALAEAAAQMFSGGMFSRKSMPVFLIRVFPWLAPLIGLWVIVRRFVARSAAVKVIDATVVKMIEERRRNPAVEKDLLQLLLQAQDSETGRWLSDLEVHGNSRVMLLAGYETTSNALAYTVFLLAQNPRAERLLLAELDALQGVPSGHRRSLDISKNDLHAYKYVSWVCNEALRLLPPVPLYSRVASENLVIHGYDVPAGTVLVASAFAIHTDPRYYPDPHAFKPERWDPQGEEQKSRPGSAFMPFGVGSRKCVGYRFALQEMQLTLIRLYSEFTFTLDPAMPLPLQLEPGITMSPWGGIRVFPQARA